MRLQKTVHDDFDYVVVVVVEDDEAVLVNLVAVAVCLELLSVMLGLPFQVLVVMKGLNT